MKKILIVGGGLAGITFAHRLLKDNISFDLIDDIPKISSSRVATGFWNPVVFKRLTKSYNADILIQELSLFYKEIERVLNSKFYYEIDLIRIFAQEEEKKLYIDKALASEISQFLSVDLVDSINGINTKYSAGIIKQTGRINSSLYISESINLIEKRGNLIKGNFDYKKLINAPGKIEYQSKYYDSIVFCEGWQAINNPLLKDLKLIPAKGEELIIECNTLSQDFAYNFGITLLPVGNNIFKAGSTFAWDDLSNEITEIAANEIKSKIDKNINTDYKIIGQVAGIRPTTQDRRPILGKLGNHDNIYVFNGLGTKGIMYAPYYSRILLNHILNDDEIDYDVSIQRIYEKPEFRT